MSCVSPVASCGDVTSAASRGIGVRYYRKRGSASYIVREVRSVREKDTERERE